MSGVISPSSPRFDPNSADVFAFDGAEELSQAWRDGLTPDAALTVSEWADRNRILSPRDSAEPGRYRTDRTPYMREIMDALSPTHSPRRVVFMKSAQVGATTAGSNFIGYVVHHAPGPMLAVQPTVELAKRFSRQRLDPLIAESPVLRERVKPARSRDAGNTVLSKEFPAGLLIITGANSAVGLRSMPARYLFLDEVDAYPPSADEEGDPVALAEARTRTFSWRAKAFLASTPTIRGLSRIEREYEASDQRRYFVPCPHCSEMQWLKFEGLRWDILQVLPKLAPLFGTPLSGGILDKAGQVAKEVFGTIDAAQVQLQIEQDKNKLETFKIQLDAATREEQAYFADVQSARAQTMELAQVQSPIAYGAPIMSGVVRSVSSWC
jgi:phage terminase large subunit GpA-like protein